MNARAIAMCAAVTAAGCSRGPSLEPVATIEQIMQTTVEPLSNAVFDAAVWENGQRVGGPRTADDWKMVQANALMLAETTNLLLMPGRAKDQVGWVIRTQTMKAAALEAAKAAEQKDTDAIFNAGTRIYEACTGCHLQYVPNLAPPRTARAVGTLGSNPPPRGPRRSPGSTHQ